MFKLEPEEKILLVLHHHWIEILGPFILFVFLMSAPDLFLPLLTGPGIAEFAMPLYLLAADILRLIVLIFGFIFWMNYYLDALVITSARAMNVKQRGIFQYEIEEFKLERVQNVTVDVPGFLATTLGYGDITIETAGEDDFKITTVPHAIHAKDLIIQYSQQLGRQDQKQQL